MDKSWVEMHPCTKEFDDGRKAFIEQAFAHGFVCASKVKCPCIDCKNMNDVNKEILYEHLTCRGMMSNYKVWHLHGEKFETTPTPKTTIDNIDGECGECSDGGDHDYIIDMLRDRFERPGRLEPSLLRRQNCIGQFGTFSNRPELLEGSEQIDLNRDVDVKSSPFVGRRSGLFIKYTENTHGSAASSSSANYRKQDDEALWA
ncbi:Transposase associated domain-containing protein [Forsythia ovata]|uniref:Transposase associated domain-containing protein n=1 Tax=Forsythia ovata TaxID=205694 RepID=A0ABD1VM15_9LAMI